MSEVVRVESIDALKHFRIALFKFQEAANAALMDAESEMIGVLRWLENEQLSHWQSQIRKRHDLLERAKEALRMKKLFKDSSGRTPSAVEEEKAVRVCTARLEEAQSKLAATKKYSRVLQREIQVYRGSVQRFATTVQADIPVAVATLDSLVQALEAYVALAPGEASATAPATSESDQPSPPPVESSEKNPPDANSKP
jgi:uncharacterized protein YifE (UPF0438 family)